MSISPGLPDPLQPSARDDSGLRDDEVSTQALLMVSRDLAATVVQKLNIAANTVPESSLKHVVCNRWSLSEYLQTFCAPPRIPTLDARTAEFMSRLRATPTPRARVIDLIYTDTDPKFAARALNTLIDTYREQQLADRAADLSRTSNWISDRVEQLRRNWLEAEARAGDFRSRSGLTPNASRDGAQPLITQQIASAATSLSSAQAELAAAKARKAALNATAASDRAAFVTWRDEPGLVALASQLQQLQTKRIETRDRALSNYPGVAAADKQIAALENAIDAERVRILRSIDIEVTVKQAAVNDLQRTLDALRADASHMGSTQVQLSTLDDEARSARTVFETFIARAKELDDRGGLLRSQVQFAAHATVPDLPSFPNVPRFLLGGVALGFLSGLGTVLAREHLSRGFSNVSRVGHQVSLPLLCAIPDITSWRAAKNIAHYVADHPFSTAAESIRALAAQMQLGAAGAGAPRSIVIASATGQEGKTTASLWLASAVASGGQRVLVIDGDHRRGVIDARLGGDGGPGFSDLIFGQASVSAVVRRAPRNNFDFIGAGEPVSRSFDRRKVERLRAILDDFRDGYDLVIIDTPPLLAISDALLYASVADATVFLCRWKRTSRQSVLSSLERLRAAEASVLGIALSMVNHARLSRFSDELTPYDVRVMKRYYIRN